jgi:hypothetical protein
MDIELTADNFLNYMGDDNVNEEGQMNHEDALLQHMEEVKKDKQDKKDAE